HNLSSFPYTTLFRSRTDSGVHALGQVIHVDYPAKIQPHSMRKALNSILDQSIRIVDVAQVSNEFHARYHAIGKEYQYRVDINDFPEDRKSTRLNSSHVSISYAVFCLKKKKKKQTQITIIRQ